MDMSPEEQGGSTIIEVDARALPGANAHDHCRKCECETGYLARYIQSNGATGIRWVCNWCEDYGTAGDLPRSILGAVALQDLPVRVDHSDEPSQWPDCDVCGQPAHEFHHWAPRAIFPGWPVHLGVPLCKPHHDEWHQTMRAHGLRYPHELTDAA